MFFYDETFEMESQDEHRIGFSRRRDLTKRISGNLEICRGRYIFSCSSDLQTQFKLHFFFCIYAASSFSSICFLVLVEVSLSSTVFFLKKLSHYISFFKNIYIRCFLFRKLRYKGSHEFELLLRWREVTAIFILAFVFKIMANAYTLHCIMIDNTLFTRSQDCKVFLLTTKQRSCLVYISFFFSPIPNYSKFTP